MLGSTNSPPPVDTVVTTGSSNLITSGAVANAIATRQSNLVVFSGGDGNGIRFDKYAFERGTKFKSGGSGSDLQITFPSAFADTNYTIVATVYDLDGRNLWGYSCRIGTKYTWGVKLKCQDSNTGADWSLNTYVEWIAIGWLP